MTIDRSTWAERIPHRGRMALIERVLSYDADGIVAESDTHRALDHPLRRDGRLHAVHLCEYGAQAMAVHGALIALDAGAGVRPGLLVALRDVELRVARIDDLSAALSIQARRQHADVNAWLYGFEIRHRGDTIAVGRAMVMLEGERQ